jgi:hypothetical protein
VKDDRSPARKIEPLLPEDLYRQSDQDGIQSQQHLTGPPSESVVATHGYDGEATARPEDFCAPLDLRSSGSLASLFPNRVVKHFLSLDWLRSWGGKTLAEFEVMGHWWLPERPEHRLAGRLVVDPVHGSHLTVIGGALREVTDVVTWVHDENGSSAQVGDDDVVAAGTYARILGEAEGKHFTLDDGMEISSRRTIMGATFWQRINVRFVFQGTHFPAEDAPTATMVVLEPAGLNIWATHSAITTTLKGETLTSYRVEAAPLPTDSAALADGAAVELRHRLGTPRFIDGGMHLAESFALAVT